MICNYLLVLDNHTITPFAAYGSGYDVFNSVNFSQCITPERRLCAIGKLAWIRIFLVFGLNLDLAFI
jgi:hypothetical protein